MIELSKELLKWIKTIPQVILWQMWEIGQEHEYHLSTWNIEDEFWRQISYAHREDNNPT